jgi:hypothetical protein
MFCPAVGLLLRKFPRARSRGAPTHFFIESDAAMDPKRPFDRSMRGAVSLVRWTDERRLD